MKKVTFCKLKNNVTQQELYLQFTNISGISSSAFLRFCCKLSMKQVVFYLLVNTSKPKFVALLVFVCTTASFTCPQVRLRTLSEQQLVDGCGTQPLKFVSNAEGSICQFLNPFFFFFRRSESRLSLFLSCKVSFLFVFLGTVPKGLARGIFLTQQNNSSGRLWNTKH